MCVLVPCRVPKLAARVVVYWYSIMAWLGKTSPPESRRRRIAMLALPALPIVRPSTSGSAPAEPLSSSGRRNDGRKATQLRPLKLRMGTVASASGSAMLELAHTKVVCSVYGPHPAEGREYMEQGQLDCSVRFASFARRRADHFHAAGQGRAPGADRAHCARAAASRRTPCATRPRSAVAPTPAAAAYGTMRFALENNDLA